MSQRFPEPLARFAAASGIDVEPADLAHAWDVAVREVDGDPQECWGARLERAGELTGFRTRRFRSSITDVIRSTEAAVPVLIAVPAEDHSDQNWLCVTRRSGRSLRVESLKGSVKPRWVSHKQFVRLLGASDASAQVEWVRLEPLEHCGGTGSDVRTHHGGHSSHHHGGHSHLSPFSRLIGLIKPERGEIWTVFVYAIGVGILTLATPIAVEALVTTVAMSMMVQQLAILALLLLGCLGIASVLKAMQSYLVEILQRRLFLRVAADLAYRLPRVKTSAFDEQYGPELVNRFFDVLTLQKVGASLLLEGVGLVLQTVIGLGLLAFYHPYLLAFDVVLLGALLYTVFMLGRGGVRSSIMESRVKYEVANQLQELTRAPIAYRVEGGRDLALDRTDVLVRKYLRARTDHFRVVFRQTAFALGFQAIASAALLGLGGWLVMEGQLTLGQLVAAELIVATIAGSFTKLGKQLEGWYDLMAAVDKLGHLVDLPLERHDGEAFHTGRSPLGLSVELLHVGYGYGHGHDILSDVSLTIPAGGKLAVVGPSGSGKSTLSEILYGLRSVSRGRIEIDGVNLRDLSLTRLRESIALVQDVEIIDGTILENVRLGRNSMRSDTIREALESVGLWDELSHLPEGMHTRLSSSGSPLSRGQARRLMLARALAGAPRLLILDEALDRLDLDSRGLVIETLFKTNPAFTLILITHDEEMARLCDRVVVLAEGRATPKKLDAGQPDLGRWLMEMRECRSA